MVSCIHATCTHMPSEWPVTEVVVSSHHCGSALPEGLLSRHSASGQKTQVRGGRLLGVPLVASEPSSAGATSWAMMTAREPGREGGRQWRYPHKFGLHNFMFQQR